jgi:hypothetical protein
VVEEEGGSVVAEEVGSVVEEDRWLSGSGGGWLSGCARVNSFAQSSISDFSGCRPHRELIFRPVIF